MLGQIVLDINTIVDHECYFIETDCGAPEAKIDIGVEAPRLAVKLRKLLGPVVKFNFPGLPYSKCYELISSSRFAACYSC